MGQDRINDESQLDGENNSCEKSLQRKVRRVLRKRCHPEPGAGRVRDLTTVDSVGEVVKIFFRASGVANLFHNIGSASLHMVPHGGFAAAQDDIIMKE
jgi:hypothetical protein